MKKLNTLIIMILVVMLSVTTSIPLSATNPVYVELNATRYAVGDIVIATVHVNLDEVDTCGIEYSFNETTLTFIEELSYWTVPGVLQSMIDPFGGYRAVWTVEDGIDFSNNPNGIINLAFRVNKVPFGNETLLELNVKLVNNNVNVVIPVVVTISNELVANYMYINNDYHALILGNEVYMCSHVLDLNNVCVFCLEHIIEDEFIIIEIPDPGEPHIEEEITVIVSE